MEINVNQPILNKHPSAMELLSLLREGESKLFLQDAVLYHNFPLYMDQDSTVLSSDLMIVSKHHGILIFKCLDQSKRTLTPEIINGVIKYLEQVYTLIYSKLVKSTILRKGPTSLTIKIKPIIFLHDSTIDVSKLRHEWGELSIIKESSELSKAIEDVRLSNPLEEISIKECISILEGAKGIIKIKDRKITNPKLDSKGRILEKIESEIATFDMEQKRSALYILDGPQRVRGLAGSGKTIVLTMKAALIHLSNPDSKIIYTYWTKSLYGFIKRLITRFYRQFADRDPDWNKIHIMHAWGGRNLGGVYYNTCLENDISPLNLREAKGLGKGDPFNVVCEKLNKFSLKQSYDYSILDEAQDFPPAFYRVCRKITKNGRVIWGYDECQNIFDIEIQDTIKTFGRDISGNPYVDFSKSSMEGQDIVLHKCYRNPRTVLVLAFTLGLGIYDKIIQSPENKEHWEDLGFKIVEGDYKVGSKVKISRPEENSLVLKNELIDKDNQAIKWKSFDDMKSEAKYVAECIIEDISEDLLPEDILVISLDDRVAKRYFTLIDYHLGKEGINTYNLLTAPSNTTIFSVDGHVTLTSVYKAKGNEGGKVYILGVDRIYQNPHSIVERNKMFTAITRARAWVTITGTGPTTKDFEREINEIISNNFNLIFTVPDTKDLKIFQRGLARQQAIFNKANRLLDEMASQYGIDKQTILKGLSKKSTRKGL